ncbi:MAG: hypothetical protein AAGI71_03970 [Bacteroidota bacterium]
MPPRFISRLRWGANRANAVNTTYEYRLTLRLGSVEEVFTDPVTTNAGKKARLQALGLFKRPINYAGSAAGVNRSDECLAMVWRYFKEQIFANTLAVPPVPLTDGQAEARLNNELQTFVMEGGVLPAPRTFKKIRIPGDFPVFYRKGDPEKDNNVEPQYTLGVGDRYAIEQEMYDANPGLGKIPIVVQVERRARRTAGAAWAPAPAHTRVYVQLLKSESPPSPRAFSGAHTLVAGARSYVDQAVAPRARNAYTVRETKQSPNDPAGGSKNRGPRGYIRRFIRKYATNTKKSDPQNGNTHWHLGGKYQMGERGGAADFKNVWGTRNAGTTVRENIFTTNPVGRFHNTYAASHATDLTDATDRKHHKYAVYTETDAAGEAGVVLCPSRIGGDRYRLQAYVYANGRKYTARTGTMVVWRTIRISRDITVQASANPGELPADLITGLTPFHTDGSCTHGANDGNYCTACLLKEGASPPMDWSGYFTTELAKAYCELLLEEKAVTPTLITAADIQHDITNHFLPSIQNDNTVNRLRFNEGEKVIVGDGVTRQFVNRPLNLANVEPGSAVLMFGGDEVTDDGAGAFPAYPKHNLLNGTINYAAGQITLNFSTAPYNRQVVQIKYTALGQLDFSNLLYFPARTPFLFNLRTPEDYNQRVQGTAFPPIPIDQNHRLDLGASDGTKHTFEGDFLPSAQHTNPRGLELFLNNNKIGYGQENSFQATGAIKFVSSINPATGRIKVVARKDCREQMGQGDGTQTRFVYNLADPPLPPLGGTQVAMEVFVAGTSVSKLIYADRTTGMSLAVPPKAPFYGVDAQREPMGVGDGNQTLFVHNLLHPPMEPLENSQEAIEIFVNADRKGKLGHGTSTSGLKDELSGGSIAVDYATGQLTVTFGTAPAAGDTIEVAYFDGRTRGTIAVDYTAGSVTVDFGEAPAAGAAIEVAYPARDVFPSGGHMEVGGELMVDGIRTAVGAPERIRPYGPYVGGVTDLVDNYLLIRLVRAIADNQGYMPGLISIRAPLRDTWTKIYKNLDMEGKGICNGFIMYMGTTTTGARNPYHVIAIHELAHTLYMNHYPSGSAAGPRTDLHDMWDNCLMGYAANEHDFCGQCLANFMGINVGDARFNTYGPGATFLAPGGEANSGAPTA